MGKNKEPLGHIEKTFWERCIGGLCSSLKLVAKHSLQIESLEGIFERKLSGSQGTNSSTTSVVSGPLELAEATWPGCYLVISKTATGRHFLRLLAYELMLASP